jgi:hypothetical protein
VISFIGGVANGCRLNFKRTPVYLRVVVDNKGKVDVLDQEYDIPQKNETLYAYRMIDASFSSAFMCGSTGCDLVINAEYKLLPLQPSQEIMRNKTQWYKWTEESDVIIK